LNEVETSQDMIALWKKYQDKFDYAAGIDWDSVMKSARKLCEVAVTT
jgi:hypothetical protein